MKASELIKLLESLSPDTEVTILTSHYDGGSERYDDQEPKIVHNIEYAVLTGEHDLTGQINAGYGLSTVLSRRGVVKKLQKSNTIVEVV